MSEQPIAPPSDILRHVSLPPGYHMVTHADGRMSVEPTGEQLTRTLSWRVTPSAYAELKVFFETFPNGSLTQAMRFLLEHPDVKNVMASRVAASRVHA